jgi:hypothetical protein
MTTEQYDRVAAFERALGLGDTSSETEAERDERERLELRLAPLSGLLGEVKPGHDLFARIALQVGADLPLVGMHVARSTDGKWRPHSDGIDIRTLWHSHTSKRHAFLLRIQPGAILQEHDHGGDEECLVLEGDMVVNGVRFGPGDFQVSFAGTRHPLVTSQTGCVCMISVALRAA